MPRIISVLEHLIMALIFIVGILLALTIYIEYSSVIRWGLGIAGAIMSLCILASMIIRWIIKRRVRK